MATDHTITDVDPRTNEWKAPDGGMITYFKVKLDSQGDREVSVGRNLSKTSAPKAGDVLHGVVEETERGLKFKSVSQNRGGSWGGGKSPEEQKRIQRQHSQEMALRYAAIRQVQGALPEFALDDLARIADWFDRDIAHGKAEA